MQSILMEAYREKDKTPYTFKLAEKHAAVLDALAAEPGGLTDSELTFKIQLHMAAARRCELRDAGLVRRTRMRRGANVWTITNRGREIRQQIKEKVPA